jgi:hypothetical protein
MPVAIRMLYVIIPLKAVVSSDSVLPLVLELSAETAMDSRNGNGRKEGQGFESINRSAVPRNRKSKHHEIVERILEEVETLRGKKALKIPRSALASDKVEHIRAALSRASAKTKLNLATSADDNYFYVWRQD